MSFDMKNEFSDDSDNEYKGELTMKIHGGITPDRIVNIETLQVIEDLLKCPICLNFLNNPYECEICGGLFCEDCINAWLKTKNRCPMRCAELKINVKIILIVISQRVTGIFSVTRKNVISRK